MDGSPSFYYLIRVRSNPFLFQGKKGLLEREKKMKVPVLALRDHIWLRKQSTAVEMEVCWQ